MFAVTGTGTCNSCLATDSGEKSLAITPQHPREYISYPICDTHDSSSRVKVDGKRNWLLNRLISQVDMNLCLDSPISFHGVGIMPTI